MCIRSLVCMAMAAAVAVDAMDEKYRVACFRAEDDSLQGCRAAQTYCCGPFAGVSMVDGVCSYTDAGVAKQCTPCRTDLDAGTVPPCDAVATPWESELEDPNTQQAVAASSPTRIDPRSRITVPAPPGSVSSFSGTSVTSITAPPAPFLTGPNAGVTLTLGTFAGMEGWLDIPESRFVRFPDTLLGLTATVPSYYTTRFFTIRYTCNSRGLQVLPAGFKGCDIFLFQYHCPPCGSIDGDLRLTLLSSAYPVWYPLPCGPVFKLVDHESLVEHPFSTLMAEIADGETTDIRLEAAVELMFWALSGKSVMCRDHVSEAACAAYPNNCQWDDDTCRPQACPRPSQVAGPFFPRCQTCTEDESQFIPTVLLQ